MTYNTKPIVVGLLMGLMLPWMVHSTDGAGAFLFALTHLAILVALGGLIIFIPAARRRLSSARAHIRHIPFMLGGLTAGWVATCIYCLAIGGQHWT
ncbi:MAG: hypothetical protein AAF340_07610 [Pseudomonadota bacterium]